jgi:hypothetical protein
MKRPSTMGLLLCVHAWACGDSNPADHDAPQRGGDAFSACNAEPITTPIGWDDETLLEISAREAFGPVAGSCQAQLSWDASNADSVVVEPRSGESLLDVRLQLDESSARLVEPQSTGGSWQCRSPYLEAEAELGLESADGTFAEEGRVTLRFIPEWGVESIRLVRKQAELGGSLQLEAEPHQQVSLSFRLSGAGDVCAGDIMLLISEAESGGGGQIATWSNTGCPLETEALALDGSSSPGAEILSRIEEVWGDASYPGVWDDGSKTNLTLAVEVEVDHACTQRTGLRMAEIPVRVTYGSDDQRLTSHVTDAHVNAFLRPDLGFSGLQLVLSERLECASPDDVLAYTRTDCSTLSAAEVQLVLNDNGGSAPEPAGLGLEVYEYRAGRTGAAAHLSRLQLMTGD